MWNDVINQERACTALRRAIERERVAHAYLFHGPDGVGKRAAALAFAQALQCEQKDGAACDNCAACRKVRRMVHPDVHVFFARPSSVEPSSSDDDAEEIARRRERMAEEPYAAVDFVRRPALDDPAKSSNKQAFYSISRVNEELRRQMSYKPVEGRYKVCLLTDAHLMRTEAANAFLKLLEEPAPRTVFVLATNRPEQLLPTTLSRCQRLRFDPLPAEAIEEALHARTDADPDQAGMVARMADGSLTRALELLTSRDLMDSRRLVLDFFRQAYTGDIDRLADLNKQIAGLGRERVKNLLDLMLRWVRDLVLYRTAGEEAQLVNVDQAEAVARFCDNLPDADLDAMARVVEEAIRLTERNVNMKLLLQVLSQALRAAMQGRPARLYEPLSDPDALAA
jgi:DNA polymerase-3 subunit delta'